MLCAHFVGFILLGGMFWKNKIGGDKEETLPYDRLGQFGRFTKYLVDHHYKLLKNGFWLAWGLHVAEALYSVKLCKTKGITDSSTQQRWFIQTFLFGIASLSHLLAYRTQLKKQR
uniref:Transmembrane protein 254 n=1 Tax=Sphenodon punctatus TaxID=8508 RepID=A0A8D0HC33_SPHPU